ncbi:MAG: 3'-flap repair endonuclease Xpf [Candidatus Micrarchaeota archaeon]|nr:MAG: 3'-flap repair endonuclease Xpf [Candidatus Micrarchaeota archaeon]
MKEIRVIVDDRERDLDILYRLEELNLDIEIRHLEIGDYLASDRIAIERKSIEDFQRSIIDGRLFKQAKRLRDSFERPVLIIEGSKEYFLLNSNVYSGAIASLIAHYNISVINTSDKTETADIVAQICKHEQIDEHRAVSFKAGRILKTDSDYMEQIVGSLPYVGPITAKELLLRFKTIRNIANASIEQLDSIRNISRKKATRIYQIFNNTYCIDNNSESY